MGNSIENLIEYIETSDLDNLNIKWLVANINYLNEQYNKKFGNYIDI